MDADRILECDVFDRDGRHLGRIDAVWRDADTGRAEFACVRRGLTADRVVPVSTARFDASRRAVVLAYPEETIVQAPTVPLMGDLEDADEARLRAHYGLPAERRPDRASRGRVGEGAAPSEARRTRGIPRASAPFRSDAAADDGADHIRLRQVLRLEREPQVRGEVERETVVEDDVVIPLERRDDARR